MFKTCNKAKNNPARLGRKAIPEVFYKLSFLIVSSHKVHPTQDQFKLLREHVVPRGTFELNLGMAGV